MDISSMHSGLIEIAKRTNGIVLTGETNLDLSHDEFVSKMKQNEHGDDYLEVITCEHKILERQGLIEGRYDSALGITFKVPSWDALVASCNAFYVSYQPCDDED
jgi:hypothetical protein